MVKNISSQNGLTLIEILLMVTLIGLVALALGQLSVVSVKSADAARSRLTANELARQALELARGQRDSNPSTFFSTYSGSYKIDGNDFVKVSDTKSTTEPPPADYKVSTDPNSSYQNFYRVVYFDSGATQKTVTVEVYYAQRGIYDKIVLQTKFTNWR